MSWSFDIEINTGACWDRLLMHSETITFTALTLALFCALLERPR